MRLHIPQPERSIHITGTNGKGSVSNLIAAGLQQAGLRVGRFSSPHVTDFRERIAVNGELISETEVSQFISKVRKLKPPVQNAFFELSFALALQTFAERSVNVAVVEAGVGAARDATIVLENVALSILTNVSLDHQGTLGPDIQSITQDKAAVVRAGTPLVTGATGAALTLLRTYTRALNAPLHAESDGGSLFELPPSVRVTGRAENQNKRLTAAALRLLGCSENAIQTTLKTTPSLPARQEVFRLRGRTVILDGAHNEAALRALGEAFCKADVLVFGCQIKRDCQRFFELLEPRAHKSIVTSVSGERPTWSGPAQPYIHEPLEALDEALELCPENGQIIITGSFYLAGELRSRLLELAGRMTA